ncbi:MFS transporter [Williamsia maris]|uniref:Drug resistance transporter, EmrB/QacA subfamily n=1 Tax=Williamsia maris TaxID=72806 RepID=A0ABT1HA96_9NOCA|nr:MFS transporter [Williamsia maris]MCP2175180.1 drug resistance transporter, EmrB/QacA subfamily [Williamsia maris]
MTRSSDVPMAEKSPVTAAPDRLTLRAIWLIAVACGALSAVVAAMAALNTALAEIAPDIEADAGQITWLVDGYTLTLAALLLPAGALGDRFGRRGMLIGGMVVFGVASLLPVFLNDPNMIIATRCLAGAGAALVMPATLSLITSGVPESKRPLAVSIWAGVAGAGAIGGFFVTGILLEFFSWHSIFITFAVASAVIVAVAFTVDTSRDANPPRFDVRGSVTSAVAIAAFVFGLIEGPVRGWDDPLVLIALIGGLALVGAFIYLELSRDHPLLDVRLFRRRAFGSGAFAIALQFLGSFGTFFLILQRLQLVLGYSPLQSAVAMFPLVIVVMVMSLLGNWLAVRFNFRAVLAPGMFVFGIGIVLLGALTYSEYWVIAILLSVMAFGLGVATAPATTAIMVSTPVENQGVGSAVNDTARELGAAIGMALAGSIVAAGYTARIGATADRAREQFQTMGDQLISGGQQARGEMVAAQGDVVAENIGRSLAEAKAVSEQLEQNVPGDLARTVLDGAQQAFLHPSNQAYIVLGALVIAGSAVLAFWAPNRLDEKATGTTVVAAPSDQEQDPRR